MKRKFFFASLMLMGASIVANAQGYKDGIEYYKVDKLDNAKELLERNLNAPSTDKAEAFYYLGQIALHQGNVAQAAANFEKGIAANAMNPYNYVGQAAIALKNGGEVKSLLEKARKLSKKDWGNAAGIYELAFDKDPNNIEAYVKYANTYFNVVPEMAIGRLEELQAKVPNSALVQRELAEKYYADNLGAKAAEQYGKYIKNPNHFAQDEVRFVQLLFFGERFKESLDLATSLIGKLNPADDKVFYMKRMQLYNLVQLKNWAGAVEAGKSFFANALPKGSNYEVRDYTDYGQALQEAGLPEQAIAAYEKALELNPSNTDLMRFMGDSYGAADNFVKAAEYYQRLVDMGKDYYKSNDFFTLSNYYLGIATTESLDAMTKADALAKSQKYIEEVDKMVPNNVQIVNQKAKIAKVREGDTNNGAALDAYMELLNILDKKEDKADYARYYKYAYNYLATYYFTKGDKAQAKTYYQKWLEYDPENEALRNYVNSLK